MLKIIGVIMICTGCTALGFKVGDVYIKHYKELIYLKKVFVMIKGEIRYNCGMLSEVFLNVSAKVKQPYKEAFVLLSEQLEERDDKSFDTMWNNIFIERLRTSSLWSEDLLGLIELGESMGYLDKQMQINSIDLFIDNLETQINEIYGKLEGNTKLYRALGVLSGLLITILIY